MSKQSRERARTSKQSATPRSAVVIGLVAVIAIAVLASRMFTEAPRAGPAAAVASSAPSAALAPAAAPGRKLLFFMNPNGYPCQTQQEILASVADSLGKVAELVYYKTTSAADMQKFEEFGIRGLPTLVIADGDGRELSRFTPGIQSGEAVLAALTK